MVSRGKHALRDPRTNCCPCLYLPCDLDGGFHISRLQYLHWKDNGVRMIAPLLTFHDSTGVWVGGGYAVGGGGRKERGGAAKGYTPQDPGEDLDIQLLCKWRW